MQLVKPEVVIQAQLRLDAGRPRLVAELVDARHVRRGGQVPGGVAVDVGHQLVDVEDGEVGLRVAFGDEELKGGAVVVDFVDEFGVFFHLVVDCGEV